MNSGFKSVTMIGALLYVSLALVSCSDDEVQMGYDDGDAIMFSTQVSRATETGSGNLNSFIVWGEGVGYENFFINGETATKVDNTNSYTLGTNYYWPSSVEKIRFWACGPSGYILENAINVSSSSQTLDYTVANDVENGGIDHKDIVIAYTSLQKKDFKGGNVSLKFYHAFSQIEIKAKNSGVNDGKIVKIKGAWIVNIANKGQASFPQNILDSYDGTNASFINWTAINGQNNENLKKYGVEYSSDEVITLTSDASLLIGNDSYNNNSSLMLIPQTRDGYDFSAANRVDSKNGVYILLECRIEQYYAGNDNNEHPGSIASGEGHIHQLFPEPAKDINGVVKYDETAYGFSCVPVAIDWQPNVKYIYTLEFFGSGGAGQYPPEGPTPPPGKEPGDPILDHPIKFSVEVSDWKSEEKNVPMQ